MQNYNYFFNGAQRQFQRSPSSNSQACQTRRESFSQSSPVSVSSEELESTIFKTDYFGFEDVDHLKSNSTNSSPTSPLSKKVDYDEKAGLDVGDHVSALPSIDLNDVTRETNKYIRRLSQAGPTNAGGKTKNRVTSFTYGSKDYDDYSRNEIDLGKKYSRNSVLPTYGNRIEGSLRRGSKSLANISQSPTYSLPVSQYLKDESAYSDSDEDNAAETLDLEEFFNSFSDVYDTVSSGNNTANRRTILPAPHLKKMDKFPKSSQELLARYELKNKKKHTRKRSDESTSSSRSSRSSRSRRVSLKSLPFLHYFTS